MRIHPPDLRLRSLLSSQSSKLDQVRTHVSGCARCQRRLNALRKRAGASTYDAALTIDTRRLQDLQVAYEKERTEARSLVCELLRHPHERRSVLIRNHPRFQTWGVF